MTAAVSCRICGSSDSLDDTGLRTCEDLHHLGEYAVYFCNSCRNGFTTPDVPEKHFELIPDVPSSELGSAVGCWLGLSLALRVRRLEALGTSRPFHVLDVGGGAGAFANALVSRGHHATIVEPNERNERFADKEHGVRFITGFFTEDLIQRNLVSRESFDFVTMWHSLEHTDDPQASLSAAVQVLKPGGMLVLSVPNLQSLLAVTGGRYWTYLDVPHHLSHFTAEGLAGMVRRAGLHIHKTYGFSWEYDLFGWYQTLLNVVSRSHNYLYNSRKKQRTDVLYLRYPRWTKAVTTLGFFLLPLATALMMTGWMTGSPACVEFAARKEQS